MTVQGMRVVLADDILLIRAGLIKLLVAAGVEVAGETGDPDELIRLVALERPQVAIIDIRMPPSYTDEGIRVARRLREHYPSTAILVLSQYLAPRYAEQLLDARPAGIGYLLKERVSDPGILTEAMRRIVDGECVVDPAIVDRLLTRSGRPARLAGLTPRERDVLTLMAQGLSNGAIADALSINERTVESVCAQVFRKLDLPPDAQSNRRVLAVLAALRH